MIWLLMSCFGGPAVDWATPEDVSMVGMLGMNGEQIAWGQVEINAGRKNGKDCVALFSLKTIKMRQDCPDCVSASLMRFTRDISNSIPDECLEILSTTRKIAGKRWSLGYDKAGQILDFQNGGWKVIAPTSEKQSEMIIFQIN